MIQIIHIEGVRKGDIETFDQNIVTFGRNPTCDVVYPADSLFIARKHANISTVDGKYIFTNFGGNGSAVNGMPVDTTELQNGDVLTFSKGGPKASFLYKNIGIEQVTDPARQIPDVLQPHKINPVKRNTTNIDANQKEGEFTLQFGSNIKSFEKFSVSLGQHSDNDFQITHTALGQHHATLFFLHNNYYIKDLNNQPLVKVNQHFSSPEKSLCINDIISLADSGPAFSYLGEGKFTEYIKN